VAKSRLADLTRFDAQLERIHVGRLNPRARLTSGRRRRTAHTVPATARTSTSLSPRIAA
jgi:hypothetical protein